MAAPSDLHECERLVSSGPVLTCTLYLALYRANVLRIALELFSRPRFLGGCYL